VRDEDNKPPGVLKCDNVPDAKFSTKNGQYALFLPTRAGNQTVPVKKGLHENASSV
jgi:hypothetical protein